MTTNRRLIAIMIVGISMVPLVVQNALADGNGSPSDPPGQSDGKHADPCALAPDPPGAANGIEKRCALGGSGGVSRGDFNNDGIADLAAGVPDETRQSVSCSGLSGCTTTNHPGAGAVNVIYGGSNGLTQTGNQVLSQGLVATSTNAHFGRALASGNFRGPGFASDLAVGAPGVGASGAIYVFFSSSGKLSVTPNQVFRGDQFSAAGTSLGAFVDNPLQFPDDMTIVWGDFNGDGFGDLAAEVIGGGTHASARSAALVLYGSASGFSTSNFTLLVFDDGLGPDAFTEPPGQPLCPSSLSCFRSRGHVSLASADLSGDGKDELLMGASACQPVDDDGDASASATGCVAIVPGRSPRLVTFNWPEPILSDRSPFAQFGAALAVGDFDGDGSKDVAVGAPNDNDVNSSASVVAPAGALWIFPDASGFDPVILTQDDAGGDQVAEAGDRFGAALAANDFDGDAISDLAVGAPGESTPNRTGNGQVTVFYGGAGVFPGTRTPSNFSVTSNGAALGSSLTAWNFGRTTQADLAAGAPFFTILPSNGTGIQGAGAVLVVYGFAGSGLPPSNMQLWTQDPGFSVCTQTPALACLRTAGKAKAGNHFGAAAY
ncbi:MAG: FG-GAP repeat protein [Actinomycetota bacterium]